MVLLRSLITTFLLLAPAAPARADRGGSPAFAPHAGVCLADIGGGHEPGLALGVRVLRDRNRGGIQLTGGAEYLQKNGSGEIRYYNGGDGTDTSLGDATVTLHYVHGYLGLESAWRAGAWRFAPYTGGGVSLLMDQGIDYATDPDPRPGFDWYDAVEFSLHFGVNLAWQDLVLEVQAAVGLSDLEEEPFGRVGSGGAYPTFSRDDRNARSVRLAAGWGF